MAKIDLNFHHSPVEMRLKYLTIVIIIIIGYFDNKTLEFHSLYSRFEWHKGNGNRFEQ